MESSRKMLKMKIIKKSKCVDFSTSFKYSYTLLCIVLYPVFCAAEKDEIIKCLRLESYFIFRQAGL